MRNDGIYAACDIGSNTILLTIVKKVKTSFKVILDDYKVIRLAEKTHDSKIITEKALKRAIFLLKKYKKIIRKKKACFVQAVATSAIRESKNQMLVLKKLSQHFTYPIKVISGQEEADLVYQGACLKQNKQIIVDIGGGSTEIILGNKNKIIQKKSLKLGIVTLTEKYFSNNLLAPKDFTKITKVKKMIQQSLKNFSPNKNLLLISVAGTPTTLACLHHKLKKVQVKKVHHTTLSIDFIESCLNKMLSQDKKTIKHLLQLDRKRADLIPMGTLILLTIMKYFKVPSLLVSTHGLRYGIIKKMISEQAKNGNNLFN